jgi:hypothetical protein
MRIKKSRTVKNGENRWEVIATSRGKSTSAEKKANKSDLEVVSK